MATRKIGYEVYYFPCVYTVTPAPPAKVYNHAMSQHGTTFCGVIGPKEHFDHATAITTTGWSSTTELCQWCERVANFYKLGWPKPSEQKSDRFPHTCQRCGQPAYIGLMSTECSGGCR